jgi:thioesterase domain-containing protein
MTDDSQVVVISRGEMPPFWLLHPVGGNVLFGRYFAHPELARQAIWGIQARGLDGRAAPFDSIPRAAAHYLRVLQQHQPRGPYFLGGPSFGGNLAFEMAQLLRRRGERVGMLALFDAFGPGYPRRLPLVRRVGLRVSRALRPNTLAEPMRDVFETARVPRNVEGPHIVGLRRVIRAHERALRAFRPLPYAGRVHLFRATEAPTWEGLSFDDPTNGWGSVAQGGVEVTHVPGTHQFILDPPWVDVLVREFGQALQKATNP